MKVRNVEAREVEDVVMDFVHSIEDLDWERFKGHISDNVTMFHTMFNDHLADSEEFFKIWHKEFESDWENAKKNGITSPPYIKPFGIEDLRIDFPSEHVAIATFHHHTFGQKNLRTCVLTREGGIWKIVHLHGSSVK